MIFESLYRIEALCPYCMVVWVVIIPLFWYTALHNLRTGNLPTATGLRPLIRAATTYHGVLLTGWYLIITAAITQRFWDYWVTLIT